MKKQERAALDAVARQFSATWETGDGAPDAWLTIAGKRTAVTTAAINKQIGGGATIVPRLRFDKVVRELIGRLATASEDSVPAGRTVIVTVTAPIKLSGKTAAALEQTIRSALTGRAARMDIEEAIHGNRTRIRIVRTGFARAPQLAGFVHNPDPGADHVLLDGAEALLTCIAAETDRRAAAGFAGDAWLIIASDNRFPPVKTWQQIDRQLSTPAGFKKILMVFAGGGIGEIR